MTYRELDPYRWRVEHWYSICGTLGNWGCFHAMNTSGWSGVWDRQRKLANEVDKKVVEEILEIGEGSGSDKDEKEQRHTDWDPTWNRNTGARRAGYDGVDEVDARDKAQAWRNGFHRRTRRGAHGAAQFSKVSFKGNTSEEVSGEEMWEEWWEDDDLYSRFGEGIDVDVDDIRLDGDGDD
ncbi:hypothetical protein M011DRAFT_464101 [Sporormia fimetaria CBS 119925]|uniref:Uncharacterized protein n=1 Tax=Sporormia fimetaria CBS 119925 TaxID=1340428 RepID=A0A6A6VQ74_9PLEO|nr:hypothetical protein M011DRAFT_464101 [Sporormia fimetaria CBS 119925]